MSAFCVAAPAACINGFYFLACGDLNETGNLNVIPITDKSVVLAHSYSSAEVIRIEFITLRTFYNEKYDTTRVVLTVVLILFFYFFFTTIVYKILFCIRVYVGIRISI